MKKIKTYCFVSMEYPEETGFGGIGTYVWHMARALAQKGIKVTIFSYSLKENKAYIENGIHVIRKKIYKPLLIWWYIAVTKFLIKNKFDIVDSADFMGSTFIYQVFFKRPTDFFHIKLHTPHKIVNYYENKNTFFQRIKTAIMDSIESKSTKMANMISSPSEILKQMLGVMWHIEDKKICVIPYPFSIQSKKIIRPPIKQSYLLYMGRIQLRKSADLLLALIEKDFLKNKKMKLVLIGKDCFSFKKKLQTIPNETSKNTILLDFTSHREELFGYISFAKLVFLPSKFDNSPFTNLESLWFNPSTFVLNNSGPMEIMMRLGLANNIFEASEILEDPEVLLKRKKSVSQREIRNRIIKNFNYKKIVKLIEKTYANN